MGERGRRIARRAARTRIGRWVRHRAARLPEGADAGMATVEYAIVTVAAAAFAGLLLLILRSDEVRDLLFGIVRGALST